MSTAEATAASASTDASRPSEDIRRTVGLTGVTTVNAGRSQSQTPAATASKPSTSTAAAAAEDGDDDDIEVLKEQSLDEVLAVSSWQRQTPDDLLTISSTHHGLAKKLQPLFVPTHALCLLAVVSCLLSAGCVS